MASLTLTLTLALPLPLSLAHDLEQQGCLLRIEARDLVVLPHLVRGRGRGRGRAKGALEVPG